MKIIIGIDVDFKGYNPFDKYSCRFEKKHFDKNLFAIIDFLKKNNYPAVFFVHTSPFIRNTKSNILFSKEYLELWKYLSETELFEIGFHPHEESETGKYYFYYIQNYMKKVFHNFLTDMNSNNISINSIRTGFFSFNEWLIPLCEKYGIKFSFDNMGAYQPLTSTHFENAPLYPYFFDYKDKEKEGLSKVYSIPLGAAYNMTLWNGLIPEANSLEHIKKLWNIIISRDTKIFWCCNMLIHTYNFLKNKTKIKKSLEYISENKGEFALTKNVEKQINLR
jgi:hypothetical protein